MKKRYLLLISLMAGSLGGFAQFTSGNLAVVRAGNGTETAGASIHIDEYLRTGAQASALQSIDIPSADATGLVLDNISLVEGIATLSANRKFLTVTGYKAAAGTAGTGGSSSASGIRRGYAIIKADGTITMSEPLSIYNGNTIRTAVSNDAGTAVWLGGGSSSVRYNVIGSATVDGVISSNAAPAIRGVAVFNGELYFNTNSTVTATNGGPVRIAKFTGLPIDTSTPYVILPGIPTITLVPNAMVLLDADGNGTADLLYVGDDNLGLTKYYYDNTNSTWVSAGSFLTTDNGTELRGLTGNLLNGKVYLYGVSGTTTGNKLISLTDESAITITAGNFVSAGNITTEPTAVTMAVLATAPAGTSFKSVTFTPGTTETTLPVKLTSFTGEQQQQTVKLNWATASEQNNAYFEVLHAADGNNFSALDKVTGNGTSNTAHSYSFTDENPSAGTNYYQLNQVDFNGKAEKSNVIAVKTNLKASTLSVYLSADNQVQANIYTANATTAQLLVTDITGRKLATTKLNLAKGYNKTSLSIPGIQPGVYVASIVIDGKTQSVKFIK